MVELQIVILAVAGSNPVGHPPFHFRFSIFDLRLEITIFRFTNELWTPVRTLP